MIKRFLGLSVFILFLIVGTASVSNAQYVLNSDSAFKAGSPNSGRIWGYMFGDYYFKGHSDSSQRGNGNQYTGIPQARTAFAFRRIYLGYDYNISKKFSAELLLAAEDNFPAGNPPSATSASGDQLSNGKLSFYIKLANIRWKNIWKGTDFIFGQVSTPTFPLLSEKIWNYRSIERTIADIRRTPSYDLGGALQGTFDPETKNFGYNVMMGNGSSAKPEGDNFKWFYGDVYAYLFNKKVVIDAYADYQRLHWTPTWHHSRQMLKGYIAYNSAATAKKGMDPGKGFTVGLEFFVNNLKNDLVGTKIAGGNDTLSNAATGVSFYVHGDLVPNKLRFFARYDAYNPNKKIDNNTYSKYSGNTGNYNDNTYFSGGNTSTGDQTYKQQFITVGLDYTPAKNVHLMPNIWYNSYASQLSNANVAANNHDLVYRLTFYYVFGK
ncbi:hypothetical protein GALL_108860 [mine drainage metagenome]|uniref:Uncharacterized protein n=1 Tax=mine drainage metagenome TaxID=410659 RepID=A0A1J5SGE9_9ZZZZ